MVDADGRGTWRNRISSSRSRPWVRVSSWWTFGSRAYTAGSAGISPSMWANRKNPRTPCIIVVTDETRSPLSPRWRM